MGQPLVDCSLNEYDENGMQVVFAIAPFGNSETRDERIVRWEASGAIDPNCPSCREWYEHPNLLPFAPGHKPSAGCRSGKRPHCTCDTCF